MEKWYFVAGFYGQEPMDVFGKVFSEKTEEHIQAKEWLGEEAAFYGFFRIDLDKLVLNEWIDSLFEAEYLEEYVPSHFTFIEIGSMNEYVLELKKVSDEEK